MTEPVETELVARLQAENADLIHDNGRQVTIASIEASRAEELQAELARVRKLGEVMAGALGACADDLSSEISNRTQGFDVYPSMHRKAELDRQVVTDARTALAAWNAEAGR